MSEQEIYQRFIDWLRQQPWELPEAEELMPLMMTAYTPEEAELLTGMPFSGRNLEELAEMKQIAPAELQPKLDAMAKRGLVFRTVRGDTVRYSLNTANFFFMRSALWPGGTDEVNQAMAPLINQYFYHGLYDLRDSTEVKGLRALPIHEVIEDTRQIMPYEELVKVLDAQDYFAVSICPCRHRKNLDPDTPDCPYPTEVCLHFGRLGRYTVENGLGREITRQETEEILCQCAEVGLIHGVTNWQEGIDTICNCCRCCCNFLEAFHKLKHAMGMVPSNYQVRTDPETCIGCGLCVKRCPMDALRLEEFPGAKNRISKVPAENKTKELKNKSGQVSVLNPDLCIGCGVCAYKCSTKSLVLERREVTKEPPIDVREFAQLSTTDYANAWAQIEQGKEK